jgi:phosphoserine phosphatase
VLDLLLTVARRLGASTDVEEILHLVIDAMRDALDAERATVFEYDPKTDELFSTVAHGVGLTGEHEIRIPSDAGLAGAAAQSREIIVVPDAYADPRFNQEVDRQTGFRTRSILTIPLVAHDDELVGVAQVLNKKTGAFDDTDLGVADALAAQAAVAMKRGRLIEDRLVRLKLERDIELARRIQQQSLPREIPNVTGFDIAAWSEPADETGGDVYDAMSVADDDRVLLLLADATGHGVGPAISVTQLRSMLRMAARLDAALPRIGQLVNDQLRADLPVGRFITAWFGVVAAGSSHVTSYSAGQAPLLHYRAADDEVVKLGPDAPPLGVIEDIDVTLPPPIEMDPGDLLVVPSDGIHEALNDRGEQFGTPRVMDLIQHHHDADAAGLVQALRREVAAFTGARPPDDDRTLVVLKRTNAGP